MPITLYFPTKAAPTSTVVLRAGVAKITRKQESPVGQSLEVAASGREYPRATTTNRQEIWPIDLEYLPTDDEPVTYHGKNTLHSFISLTLNNIMNPCEVEDDLGNTIIARYIRGIESLREGGARQGDANTATQWFGTITFRKVL